MKDNNKKENMAREIKDWTKIFKGFGNENRLKILKILYPANELPVSEISAKIKLSLKSTSKHLIQLSQLNILESEGKKGQVYYQINPGLDSKIIRMIQAFVL